MDAKDIWLLVAGTILGFVTNILSTFAVPTVGSVFGRLKSGFIERNKAKAIASYCLVSDLKTGKRDKYLYALSHVSHMCFLTFLAIGGGAIGLAAGVTVRPLLRDQKEAIVGAGTNFWFALVVTLPILFIVVRIFSRSAHLALTLSRLERFDQYRAELLLRWPDLTLPE